ncbi:MAG: hypothetical protein JO321_16620 [Solirubrobacterales bacterium]|nr:hypothetical protein [Solirubrobacterales bacterium]MBV9537023.1 hypothetical protein [Solirubrobacterales bacterium]
MPTWPPAPQDRIISDAPVRADALADIVLPDQDGNEVRLGDLWHDRPVALVWLRHWG